MMENRESARDRKIRERRTWKLNVTPKQRRAPKGWAKEMFKMMRLMPLFENKRERNLWRRRRQGRITHEQFKEAVRRMIRESSGHQHHDHERV